MKDLLGIISSMKVYDLEHLRKTTDPTMVPHAKPGYSYFLHRRHGDTIKNGRRSNAGGVVIMYDHVGTHIDALSHQGDAGKIHGGIDIADVETPWGFKVHGAEEIPPLVGRAVLVDLPRHRGGASVELQEVVQLREVEAALEAQGLTVKVGDILLVRTGSARLWGEDDYLHAGGMHGDVSRWAAAHKVICVGADNAGWDHLTHFDQVCGIDLPGHYELLVKAGIFIMENLNMEELAQDGINECLFMCSPIKMVGATGSPVRPLAFARPQQPNPI